VWRTLSSATLPGYPMTATAFLDELAAAARSAELTEQAYRREVAARIAILEQERAFAFRRVNLMKSITETVTAAESEEIAVSRALAVLRARLGWVGDSEVRNDVLSRFSSVAQAIFAKLAPEERDNVTDVRTALEAFENWYAQTHKVKFWQLFEHHIPETPRVDF
jgi:hypothetical protein